MVSTTVLIWLILVTKNWAISLSASSCHEVLKSQCYTHIIQTSFAETPAVEFSKVQPYLLWIMLYTTSISLIHWSHGGSWNWAGLIVNGKNKLKWLLCVWKWCQFMLQVASCDLLHFIMLISSSTPCFCYSCSISVSLILCFFSLFPNFVEKI